MDVRIVAACLVSILLACGQPSDSSRSLSEPAKEAVDETYDFGGADPFAKLMLKVFEEDLDRPESLTLDQFSLSFCAGTCKGNSAALQRSVAAETIYLMSPSDFVTAKKRGQFESTTMKSVRLVANARKVYWQPAEGEKRKIGSIQPWAPGGHAVELDQKGEVILLVSDLDQNGGKSALRLWGTAKDRSRESEIGNNHIVIIGDFK